MSKGHAHVVANIVLFTCRCLIDLCILKSLLDLHTLRRWCVGEGWGGGGKSCKNYL